MNSMQLSCFVEVATELSFSKAAEHLHVSQPTVSHQVRSLEDELGAALLARSTRTVRLTDEGFAFLSYAQEMLGLEARAKRQLGHGRREGEHTLKVGVHDGFEAHMAAPALRELRAADPAFAPVVRQGPYPALRDMLEAGTVDVVPAYRDPHGEPDGASSFRRIRELPVRCVCAADHPLARLADERGGPLTLDDLRQGGALVAADPHRCAPALLAAQREVAVSKRPEEMVVGADVEVNLALVGAGIGFAMLPDAPRQRREGLRYLEVEGAGTLTCGVRVRRGRRAALVERFVELYAQALA